MEVARSTLKRRQELWRQALKKGSSQGRCPTALRLRLHARLQSQERAKVSIGVSAAFLCSENRICYPAIARSTFDGMRADEASRQLSIQR